MSWKGLQKAVSRLPHQILSNKSETTQDAEYIALETKFKTYCKAVERLQVEAQSFCDATSDHVARQYEMAQHLADIYDAQLGEVQEEDKVLRRHEAPSAETLQAITAAQTAMENCSIEVRQELQKLEYTVLSPAVQLVELTKVIQKTMEKRNRKCVDYDRHRANLRKLQNKSGEDPSKIFKVESDLERATQDFEYLNDMIKRELPQFFALMSHFIQPAFESFYYIQYHMYGTIYARCHELLNNHQQHFVTLGQPIDHGYSWRIGQYDARSELDATDLLRDRGKAWLVSTGGSNSSKLSLQERAALRDAREQPHHQQDYSAGPYTPTDDYAAPSTFPIAHQEAPGNMTRRAPPPPPAASTRSEFVTALYDYDAQANGDLSFRRGDKIELVEKTDSTNDWWTGRLGSQTGVFPANYVEYQ